MSSDCSSDEENTNSCKSESEIGSKKEKHLKQDVAYMNLNGNVSKFDIVYEINGERFREKNFEYIDNDFCEFQVDLVENMTFEEFEIDDIYLDVSIDEVKRGVIVNSDIFLSQNQWNTLILEGELFVCLVCDDIVDTTADHINEEIHKDNLQQYKPLKKFECSIVRMINSKYHCAVCNEIFEVDTEKTHFNGENHKQKMLYAQNRGLDVDLDENFNKFNENFANGIHVDNNGISDLDDDFENLDGDCNGSDDANLSCASMASKPNIIPDYITQVVGDRTLKFNYDSWNMIITPWENKFYCMSCKISENISLKAKHCMGGDHLANLMRCTVVESYNRFLMRQIDSKYYHCGYCNALVLISNVENHIDIVHENKFKNIDKVTSQKNVMNQNSTYETNDSLFPNKSTTGHKSNIDLTNGVENNNSCKRVEEENRNTDAKSNESYKNVLMNQSKIKMLRALFKINNESPGINNDIILDVFKWRFRISFLAYNTMCRIRKTKIYYCALCNLHYHRDNVELHFTQDEHMDTLKALPYEEQFGNNLIRLLQQGAHCSFCNTTYPVTSMVQHVNTTTHLSLLNQAKTAIIPDTPIVTENIGLPKRSDLNPTMHPPKTDSYEIKVESNQKIKLNETNESVESIERYKHEFIYMNFKNMFYKITFNAFNSLVVVGDGTRYCFVCSVKVVGCLQKHIESVNHAKCMEECKFIDKYDKHVLRQIHLTYHCCVCNVMFTKKHLTTHLSWPTENIKTNKKIRKADEKSGIKIIKAKIQNEQTYLDMQEPKIEIIRQIHIKKHSNVDYMKRQYKIVRVQSNVFKIRWHSWQGLRMDKKNIFCNICEKVLKEYEINRHINEYCHSNVVENTFYEQYYPDLVRNVNDTTANCVICNLFILNDNHIILEHLNGKYHKINYNNVIVINNDYDSSENVLIFFFIFIYFLYFSF